MLKVTNLVSEPNTQYDNSLANYSHVKYEVEYKDTLINLKIR